MLKANKAESDAGVWGVADPGRHSRCQEEGGGGGSQALEM